MDNADQLSVLRQAAKDIKTVDRDIVDVMLIENTLDNMLGLLVVDQYAEEFEPTDSPHISIRNIQATDLAPYPRTQVHISLKTFNQVKNSQFSLPENILVKESLLADI